MHTASRTALRAHVSPRRATQLFAAVLVLVPAAIADVGGVWQPETPLQTPRQETGAARIGNHVYVAGGLLTGPAISATASVERYDVTTGTWTFVAPLPAPRDHHGMCAQNGLVYAIGGYAGDFAAKSEVWSYSPAANAWTPRAPLPEARGGCWAVAHGSRIYVFGGVSSAGAVVATTFVYDPVTNTWSSGLDMPTAREHLNAEPLGAFIHVIGGRGPGGSTTANERYDPLADQWLPLAPMPTARSASATAVLDGLIFVMGGEVPVLSAKNEVYDPFLNSWSAQEEMVLPRHGIAAVALDDRIFLPAGGVVQGLQPTSQADSFRPLAFGARHACECGSGAPCNNTSPEAGCANSTGTGGLLTATGRASVGFDTLVLHGQAMPATTSVLYFQGTQQIAGGAGVIFGDGKRCAGGTVVRLGRKPNVGGASRWPEAGDPPISVRGMVPVGATRTYQAWYRNPAGPCGSGSNLTNGVRVSWGA